MSVRPLDHCLRHRADDIEERVSDVQTIQTEVNTMTNTEYGCYTDGEAACSNGSTCIEGDVGVYCECYERLMDEEEVNSWIHVVFDSSRDIQQKSFRK